MDGNPVFTTGNSLDYAELNPSFIVRVGSGGTNGANIGVSSDGGQTWTPGTSPSGAFGRNSRRVVWSSGSGVFFSIDNGTTWTPSTGAPARASVRSDRVNPLKFYAFANGTFYISTDGGRTFAATAANNLPPAGTSAQFKATPGREGDIWLAGGAQQPCTASGIRWMAAIHSGSCGMSTRPARSASASPLLGASIPRYTAAPKCEACGAFIAPTMPDLAGRELMTLATNTH